MRTTPLVVAAAVTAIIVLASCGPAAQRPAALLTTSPTASPATPLPVTSSPTATVPPSPSHPRSTPARPRTASAAATQHATTHHPVARPAARYVFPIRGCRTSYARVHHDYPATDIWAARGCAFVSPVAGVVDEVSYVDRWSAATNRGADRGGLSVSVVGADGVRYYGSHLSSIAAGIRPGVHVAAGRLLGRVGDSGDARAVGSHLHFGISWPTAHGIWWVRRGEVFPWSYLDSWRGGGQRSPVAAVRSREAALGRTPACSADC